MTDANTVAAILLAAGRSRRMGAFKLLLDFGGQTVIESSINNLRQAGVQDIVVVTGHRANDLHARLAPLPVRLVVNPDELSEMGASIACGVKQLSPETQATLIALGDQPAIPSDVISFLIAEWRRTRARIIVPTHEGRGGHPVLIDLHFREELLHLDPQRGLRALMDARRNEALRVAVQSPYVARDMDTWEDYSALYNDIFGALPPRNELP